MPVEVAGCPAIICDVEPGEKIAPLYRELFSRDSYFLGRSSNGSLLDKLLKRVNCGDFSVYCGM